MKAGTACPIHVDKGMIHAIASFLDNVPITTIILGFLFLGFVILVRAWAGGRTCTRERDWAGKMILVVVGPL